MPRSEHTIPCDKCGAPMQACYHMANDGMINAWLCLACKHVSCPIFRERKFQMTKAPQKEKEND